MRLTNGTATCMLSEQGRLVRGRWVYGDVVVTGCARDGGWLPVRDVDALWVDEVRERFMAGVPGAFRRILENQT